MAATVSALVEAPAVFLCVVAGAWVALAVVVGLRNVLDAGCYFMLLVVGVILVVELALDGPGALLP
jgi:hypothetical protein